MAKPIPWHGQNKILKGPEGRTDYISDINVFNNGTISVSCWQLSGEEIAELATNGGLLFIGVMGGRSQAPMIVGNEKSIRAVCLDTGPVWNKQKSLDERFKK